MSCIESGSVVPGRAVPRLRGCGAAETKTCCTDRIQYDRICLLVGWEKGYLNAVSSMLPLAILSVVILRSVPSSLTITCFRITEPENRRRCYQVQYLISIHSYPYDKLHGEADMDLRNLLFFLSGPFAFAVYVRDVSLIMHLTIEQPYWWRHIWPPDGTTYSIASNTTQGYSSYPQPLSRTPDGTAEQLSQ